MMAKQYLAAPATSAAVERIFSRAGQCHGDLQKASKEGRLENRLIAAVNCP